VSRYGRTKAVRYILRELDGMRTPDGAKYNARSIRLAIEGM
jgi:hypothetical protein